MRAATRLVCDTFNLCTVYKKPNDSSRKTNCSKYKHNLLVKYYYKNILGDPYSTASTGKQSCSQGTIKRKKLGYFILQLCFLAANKFADQYQSNENSGSLLACDPVTLQISSDPRDILVAVTCSVTCSRGSIEMRQLRYLYLLHFISTPLTFMKVKRIQLFKTVIIIIS